MAKLQHLHVQNYRSLENLDFQINNINVLFGPNGAGKSTILDTLWFLKDCIIRGVEEASSERNHGIGLRWETANQSGNISIKIASFAASYEVEFGFSSGRIEPYAGEHLKNQKSDIMLIDRSVGSDQAIFYHHGTREQISFPLREPETFALTRYIDFEPTSIDAQDIYELLYYANFYHARAADLYRLKKYGSETNHHFHLYDRCQNLWSVLRNLEARRNFDDRYSTIIDFMRESFPAFKNLYLEQTGPNSIYGYFIEKNRQKPVQASGVSDGQLQMLANLTAIFSMVPERESIIVFDEPDISLHPHAISVFAHAVKVATEKWNKQIFIATHSPVLLSQFDSHDIFAIGTDERGSTSLQRVSDIEGIQDLLEDYATGSLYMAGILASQSDTNSIEGV
jgi:predicted ATPase